MPSGKFNRRLVWLWSVVPVVVLLEIIVQWRIGADVPKEDEWKAAAVAVRADKGENDLVVIAPDWATQGRLYLGDLITLKDFGRFDATEYNRILEISVNGARSPESENLEVISEKNFGNLDVVQYKRPSKAAVVYDFLDDVNSASITGIDVIRPRLVIDHWFFPRLVIPIKLRKKSVSVVYEDVPLDADVIRGYGIVGYRSGRFNESGPITLAVYVEEKLVGEHVVRNFGPKTPFEFQIPGNTTVGKVRFEIRAKDGFGREFGFAADIRMKNGGRSGP